MIKKLLILSTLAIVSVPSLTLAGDLSKKTNVPVLTSVSPSPASKWGGAYLGLEAGYGFVNKDANLSYTAGTTNATYDISKNNHDIPVKAFLGYNYQIDNLVLGLEAGVTARIAKKNDTVDFCQCTLTQNYPFQGNLNLRAGYVLNNALLYVTGGGSVASYKFEGSYQYMTNPVITSGQNGGVFGWNVGAGIDYKIDKNWFVRAQYLHAEFPSHDYINKNYGINAQFKGRQDDVTVGLGFIF